MKRHFSLAILAVVCLSIGLISGWVEFIIIASVCASTSLIIFDAEQRDKRGR